VNARRLAALLPVPATFALGGALARWWFDRAPERYANDLAQPLVVVTAWGAYGGGAFAILAATVLCAAIALAVAALRSARGAGRGDLAAVELCAALAIAFAIGWPFVFSSDCYAYAAYGAMMLGGLDPYTPLPAHVHGAFLDAARWQWSGAYPVCVYGPLFVALATATVGCIGSHGVGVTLFAFRVLAALAFLGSIALLDRALADAPAPRRYLALCAYGLNPVCLWAVAEGHNDAFLLLAIMAAAAFARERAPLAAFALGLSPLLKAPGAAFAFAAVLDAWSRRSRDRVRVTLAAAGGLVLAACLVLPPLRPALASLGAHGRYAPEVSLQGLIGPEAAFAIAILAGAYGLWCLRLQNRAGYAWIGIGLLSATPNGYPWYALWLVPWSLAAGTGWASRALWGATIASVARYLPDAAGTLGPEAARLAAAAVTFPLAFALADAFPTAFVRKKAPVQP